MSMPRQDQATPSLSDHGLDSGDTLMAWAHDLFPICRSLTGAGVRQTLSYLTNKVPGMTVKEVPSGTKAFDWTVPQEWEIGGGWLEGPDGQRIVDFDDNNLHVMGYSEGVDCRLPLEELQQHLYSLADQPDAIPYVTSYYNHNWGFCLPHRVRESLKPGQYRAVIEARHFDGVLNYGELIVPGETEREVLLSTYICHPSMANNELSGPLVATALARWLHSKPRRLTYRLLFVPETIGAIVYLSQHLEDLRQNVIAGYVLSCVGDDGPVSFLPSPSGNTLADRAAEHVLAHHAPDHLRYSFLDRGSDERQYCSPLVDLPVASVMRSKYGTYPEYHTSLDDLSFISAQGLATSVDMYRRILSALEANQTPANVFPCEPQLGKRGLYPTVSTKDTHAQVALMKNVIAYADGRRDMIALSEAVGSDIATVAPICRKLADEGVLTLS
jgi:aminopeptidase-like protein